jgi:hypothetical protein
VGKPLEFWRWKNWMMLGIVARVRESYWLLLNSLGLYWAESGESCEGEFDAFYEGAETLTCAFFRCERANFDVRYERKKA